MKKWTQEELAEDVLSHASIAGLEYAAPFYYVADFGRGNIGSRPVVYAYSDADDAMQDVLGTTRKILLHGEKELYNVLYPDYIEPFNMGYSLLYYIPGYDIDITRDYTLSCAQRYHVTNDSDIVCPHIKCMVGKYKLIAGEYVYIVCDNQDIRNIDTRELRADISYYYSDCG